MFLTVITQLLTFHLEVKNWNSWFRKTWCWMYTKMDNGVHLDIYHWRKVRNSHLTIVLCCIVVIFCDVCLLDPKVYLFIVMIWVVFVWLWLCSTNVYDKYPSPLWFMGLTLPSWSDILNMKWCLSMTDWRLVYFFLEIHCLQHKLNWSTGKLLNIGINNLNQCFRCMELTVSWTKRLRQHSYHLYLLAAREHIHFKGRCVWLVTNSVIVRKYTMYLLTVH